MNTRMAVDQRSSGLGAQSRGAALVRDSLVWDECISWTSMDLMGADKSIKLRALPDYLAAGVKVASLTIAGDYGTAFHRSQGWLASERRFIKESLAEVCILIERLSDIERARATGKLAITFHFQGGSPFLHFNAEEQGSVDLVSYFYSLGVRRALLAHNHRNALSDGCMEPADAGLSLFGRRIVREMTRVGMVVDCTHMGRRSSLEAMEIAGKPCVFSHSNVAAICRHPRNIDDEQIRACAGTGGVIGIAGWGPIVNSRNDTSAAALAEHLLYVIDRVGPAHVGIGLDYVYQPQLTTARIKENAHIYAPDGPLEKYNYHHDLQSFAPPAVFAELADILLDRGFSTPEVKGVLGENWLRVAQQNWRE